MQMWRRLYARRSLVIKTGGLAFLATVGTTAPFIGLFGTVWGIMGAFQSIGATGSTSPRPWRVSSPGSYWA